MYLFRMTEAHDVMSLLQIAFTVTDDDHRLPGQVSLHRRKKRIRRCLIEPFGGLIHDIDRRLAQKHSGNRYATRLSHRHGAA